MYYDAIVDEIDINAGTTRISEIFESRGHFGICLHLEGAAIQAGTTYVLEGSGRNTEPTNDDEWTTIDSGSFDLTAEPTIVDVLSTQLPFYRYKVIAAAGSNLTGFYGSIGGKGGR